MNYYFLVSSLPHVSIGEPPAISFDKFAEICSEHLSKDDMSALNTIAGLKTIDSSHSFIKAWKEKETLLRNAIAKIRASRLNRDSSSCIKEVSSFDASIEKVAADAFAKPNPLEKELLIDKHRWHQLEELQGFNMFSSSAILSYAVKLKIAERWAALNRENAKATADDIVNRNPEHAE